jgi:predicted PhzF superfamily epimerase YddE/YHI9
MKLDHRILNVFTDGDNPFSGKPLFVFGDATGLSDGDKQDLARQLNLCETTFVTPGDGDVGANVRIFTPNYEMPLARHPTPGTAFVVRELSGPGGALVLRMPAGDIQVRAVGNSGTLQANAPTPFPVQVVCPDLGAMIGLTEDCVAAEPLWVDTGTSADPAATVSPRRQGCVGRSQGPGRVRRQARRSVAILPSGTDGCRHHRGPVLLHPERHADRGTGHRIGLRQPGGWFLANAQLGIRRDPHQGSEINRRSVLDLTVGQDGTIRVGGAVREVGAGTFTP